MPIVKNYRLTAFNLAIDEDAKGFFVFGPVSDGEVIRSVRVDALLIDNHEVPVVFTQTRVFRHRPTLTDAGMAEGLDTSELVRMGRGNFVAGTAGVLHSTVSGFMPVDVQGGGSYRYCVLEVDNSGTSDIVGVVTFDVIYRPQAP